MEQNLQTTKVQGSESFLELSFPGAKVPGSEWARERIGQGAKGLGSESFRERKGHEAKGPRSKMARHLILLANSLPGANWSVSEKDRYLENKCTAGTVVA